MEISKIYQQPKLNLSYIFVPTSIGPPADTAVETSPNPNPLIGTVSFQEFVAIL